MPKVNPESFASVRTNHLVQEGQRFIECGDTTD